MRFSLGKSVGTEPTNATMTIMTSRSGKLSPERKSKRPSKIRRKTIDASTEAR